MEKGYYLALPLILLAACSARLEAATLKVSPGAFIVHNVVPGQKYDVYEKTGLQLAVYNDSPDAQTYRVSAHRPAKGSTLKKGYLEIPDAKWCWFDQEEIKVEANSQAYVRFHLKIPDEQRYYNQRWVVALNVSCNPRSGGLSAMGVAIDVRAQIETQAKSDMKGVNPDGPIGVVPAVITLKATEKGEVDVFNNSAADETYKIYLLADKADFQAYTSAGLTPLPDPDWIKLGARKLKIPAGGRKTLSLKSMLPEKEADSTKQYEAVIFIEGQSASGFVRVRFAAAG